MAGPGRSRPGRRQLRFSQILHELTEVIKLNDRVRRLETAVEETARAFREDAGHRDKRLLAHDRRIQRIENLMEFAERFGRTRKLEQADGT